MPESVTKARSTYCFDVCRRAFRPIMRALIFYSSPDCCLCDDALAIVMKSEFVKSFNLEKKNIYLDKSLLVKYRHSIPVIQDASSQETLYWPFSEQDFCTWINHLQQNDPR